MNTCEVGIVKEILGVSAKVLIARSSACEGCESQGVCKALGGKTEIIIEALNEINAKKDDHVTIEMPESSIIKIAFLVYIVQILALIIGLIVGIKYIRDFSISPEIMGIICGSILFIVSFLVIKIVGKIITKKKKYKPVIASIVSNKQ